jgi:hypothetical protein
MCFKVCCGKLNWIHLVQGNVLYGDDNDVDIDKIRVPPMAENSLYIITITITIFQVAIQKLKDQDI